MRAPGRLLPLAAAALALVGCGGATSGPNTTGAAPPPPPTGANTVTVSPFGSATQDDAPTTAAVAVFPAETPSGVLDLAAQHPDGRVTYAIVHEGSQGELTVTRLGTAATVAVTTDAGTTRVGVDIDGPSIRWVCTAAVGEDPACYRDDAGGAGAKALATAAALVGEDRVRQLVAAASATSDANVAVRTQANQVDASCVSGSGAAGALVLCVSPSGFVTDAEGDGQIARAISVTPDVAQSDLDPPAPTS